MRPVGTQSRPLGPYGPLEGGHSAGSERCAAGAVRRRVGGQEVTGGADQQGEFGALGLGGDGVAGHRGGEAALRAERQSLASPTSCECHCPHSQALTSTPAKPSQEAVSSPWKDSRRISPSLTSGRPTSSGSPCADARHGTRELNFL
jgi:hypothetical protein